MDELAAEAAVASLQEKVRTTRIFRWIHDVALRCNVLSMVDLSCKDQPSIVPAASSAAEALHGGQPLLPFDCAWDRATGGVHPSRLLAPTEESHMVMSFVEVG